MRDGYFTIDASGPAGGVVRLRLGGSLDIGARDDVREAIITAAAGDGVTSVTVDLEQVRFLDSEALAGLIEGFLRARSAGVAVRAVHPQGIVLRVLEVTGTLELFGVT